MVYDDSKNFIGDLHYRDADELQEGEELRLDKGVLVDVGRRTGQTETDLAEVLDKGTRGDEGTQAKQAAPRVMYQSKQRVPSAIPKGRPKSLAAVLGASQGPIGRARLALKSPYEQLHTTHPEPVLEQQPAKRQRMTTDKENTPTMSKTVRVEQQPNRSRPPPSFSPSLPRAPLAVRKEVNTPKTVIDISSEGEDPLSPMFSSTFKSSRSRQRGTKAIRNPPAKLDLAPKPPKSKQKLLPKLLSIVEPPNMPSNAQEKQTVSAKPGLISQVAKVTAKAQAKQKASTKLASDRNLANVSLKASKDQDLPAKPALVANKTILSKKAQGKQTESILLGSSTRSACLSSGPKSSLRFASQKPRPKLMYEALLPSSFVANRPESLRFKGAATARGANSMDLISKPRDLTPRNRRSRCAFEKGVFDLSGLERFSAHPQRAPTPVNSPPRLIAISPAQQSSSPLFCTQSPKIVMPDVVAIEEDSSATSPMKRPLPNVRSDIERSVDLELLKHCPFSVQEPEPAPQLPSASKLTLMDQRLMMPPPRIEPPSPRTDRPTTRDQQYSSQVRELTSSLPPESPQPRPFRRVLSESDSPTHCNTMLTISPLTARIPSALTGMQQRTHAQSLEPPKPFKSPAKLQRSHSDTSAMLQIEMQRPIGRFSVNVPEIVDEKDDKDVGPWSSREAFLLFDWWPPGRQKPDYGHAIEHHLPQQSFGGFTHPRNAESFGELHGVIRNGIDI